MIKQWGKEVSTDLEMTRYIVPGKTFYFHKLKYTRRNSLIYTKLLYSLYKLFVQLGCPINLIIQVDLSKFKRTSIAFINKFT